MEKYSNQKSKEVKYPILLINSLKLNALLEKLKILFKLTEVSGKEPTSEGYVKYMNIMISDGKYASELGVGEINEEVVMFLDEQQVDYTYYESKGVVKKLSIKDFIDPRTLNPKICDEEDTSNDIEYKEEVLNLEDISLDDLFDEPTENSPIEELIPTNVEWR